MKILIIGAGISGITAGHLLHEHGIDFEILEATSTYGGRIRKVDDFADFPIDLGAEWIHTWIGAKPTVFEALLAGNDARFPTFKDKPATHSIWKDGKLTERNWIRFIPKPPDLKFSNATWFDALDTLVTPELVDRTSFNSPVANIDYTGASVAVATEGGFSHEADKVLVTVPLKMLQRQAITFNPPLPDEKTAEIMAEEVPGGLKVFIDFAERFYPDVLYVGGLLANVGRTNCGYYDAAYGKQSKQHILGFFTQGASAERYTAHQTDDELFAYVLSELDEIFDGQASQHYIKHVVQDWTREPYIKGSYSQRKASAKTLADPIANKVFFAGEAMNPNGKTVAVHGASESAYTAVDAMLVDQPN